MRVNIYDTIRKEAADHLGNAAVIDGERQVSYAELFATVDAVAHELEAAGLGWTQRVALTVITVAASTADSSPADVAPAGGDGIVGVLDFLAVVADWGLTGPRPTDIDESGTVDIGDILMLLGEWTA